MNENSNSHGDKLKNTSSFNT